jgi:uncharacterized protein (DUF302 family)
MNQVFVVGTAKSFDHACADLEAAVLGYGFGLMAIHDLGETLRSQGIGLSEACRVFEVCDLRQAVLALEGDISLSVALPCRISVYTDAGQTRFGVIRPGEMLKMLAKDPERIDLVQQGEAFASAMINQAALPAELLSHEVHQGGAS